MRVGIAADHGGFGTLTPRFSEVAECTTKHSLSSFGGGGGEERRRCTFQHFRFLLSALLMSPQTKILKG